MLLDTQKKGFGGTHTHYGGSGGFWAAGVVGLLVGLGRVDRGGIV